MPGLSQDKIKSFVAAYIETMSATKAARKIGYTGRGHSAYTAGQRLLARKDVQALLKSHLETQHMTAAEIVARLSRQARADIGDFLDETGDVNLSPESPTFLIRALSQVVKDSGETSTRIELHDAQDALIELAKIAGLYQKGDQPDPFANLSLEERAERIRAVLSRASQDEGDTEP